MPMLTSHIDCPTPSIRTSGGFTTISWDRGLSIQLDAEEWQALVQAIDSARFNHIEDRHALIRHEETVRTDAEIREELQ